MSSPSSQGRPALRRISDLDRLGIRFRWVSPVRQFPAAALEAALTAIAPMTVLPAAPVVPALAS
jgi:hypothetical protein